MKLIFLHPGCLWRLPEKYKRLEVFNSIPTLEQLTRIDKETFAELEELQIKATDQETTQLNEFANALAALLAKELANE